MRSSEITPASTIPDLPELLPDAAAAEIDDGGDGRLQPIDPIPVRRLRSVRPGCWLINYTPAHSLLVSYDGTMRVESKNGGRTASGDLYQRPVFVISRTPLRSLLGAGPSPANGIPVLPRGRYRFYLRVTQILESLTFDDSFTLGFELHRFTIATGAWALEGKYAARMTWITAPSGYPSAQNYLEGDVRNAAGAVTGRLKMGWLSPRLRKVKVEIDAVAGSEQPLDSGAGADWATVFDAVNWDGAVSVSDTNVAPPSGPGWSDAEMHAAMLARRDAVNLDQEWHYHILAVRTIDSTPRGIMYDAGGTDSNNVPREGVGISTHWTIPNTPEWGQVRGQRFGAAPAPFFRTAVHELGHAFGLYHNTVDNGFMNTTDVIAASATAAQPFPTNIVWAFAPDDLKRLRHYPDVYVRPGGTAFGTASTTTPLITPDDESLEVAGLTLRVTPLLGEVPIGAPVRVKLELVNTGDTAIEVPATLSLKSDFVRGWVTDPSGAARSYSPVVRCLEDAAMHRLEPGATLAHDLTLMRGAQGALFPAGGLYTVAAEVRWDADGIDAVVRGAGTVLVTGVESASHAAAAHAVLATPDAHLVLVFGGDHLPEGVAAIQIALADETLKPHFAVIEAKRVAGLRRSKGGAKARVDKLIDKNSVMSASEATKLARLTAARTGAAEGGPRHDPAPADAATAAAL